MEFIPVPGVAEVTFHQTSLGEKVVNVLHYFADTLTSAADLDVLAFEAFQWWATNAAPLLPDSVSLDFVRAKDLTTESGAQVEYGGSGPEPGQSASPALPNGCALVITKRTSIAGRSYRGRIYVCGLIESNVDGNTVQPTTVTNWLDAWGQALTVNTTGPTPLPMVVVSRFFEGAPRVTGIHTEVTELTSDGFVDSQRRRLAGRGS